VKLTEPPRRKRPGLRVFTPEQAQKFIQTSETYRLGPLYCTMLALGVRLGEALALRWEDVSLDHATAHVTRAIQRIELPDGTSELQFVEPKSDKSYRMVVIPASIVVMLGKHRAAQNRERLLVGARWRSGGLVFASTIGTPLDERNVRRDFVALLKAAKLPVMRLHDLRHSYATILLAAGEHPKVVQETLGHSSVQLTLDTYSHLLPDMGLKERAAARLDALLTAPVKVEPAQAEQLPGTENSGQNSGQNEEEVVSRLGIEPRTRRLRVCCSAN
jgi:integrase